MTWNIIHVTLPKIKYKHKNYKILPNEVCWQMTITLTQAVFQYFQILNTISIVLYLCNNTSCYSIYSYIDILWQQYTCSLTWVPKKACVITTLWAPDLPVQIHTRSKSKACSCHSHMYAYLAKWGPCTT